MVKLTAQVKTILRKAKDGDISKSEGARSLNISRKTLYALLKGRTIRKTRKELISGRILAIVAVNPKIGPKKISQALLGKGVNLSSKSVWQELKVLNLETADKRENFSFNFTKPRQARDNAFPTHLRLLPDARKRMVESRELSTLKVSRKTYAKWNKRYQKAFSEGLNIMEALSDACPRGFLHPKGTSKENEEAILSLVVEHPEFSSHRLAMMLKSVGNHGVQGVLERNNLSHYEMRKAYAAAQVTMPIPIRTSGIFGRVRSVFETFVPNLAPAPPTGEIGKKTFGFIKTFFTSTLVTSLFTYSFIYWIRLLGSASTGSPIGLIFSTIALIMGSFFFLYSCKYYLTIAVVLSFSQGESRGEGDEIKKKGFFSWLLGEGSLGKGRALRSNLDNITLKSTPYVSVHIPFYNERNVVKRSIEAVMSFDYPAYEVILCDDSTDETTGIIRNYQKEYLNKGEDLKIEVNEKEGWELSQVEVKPGVMLRHLHRTSRSGFKGGALRLALRVSDPRAEFISVFDADFVPYPDTLQLFLKNFKVQNGMSEDYSQSKVAAVQGYQWHVLNKSENWITRGVRSEYAGSYVIERSGEEIYGGLKQISGAVYMIRKEPLKEVGWGVSITEDFELTLKLYAHGYKVLYTPYIQAPAECVSTLKRLIKQRMRWAEGHSNNIKKMFTGLMTGGKLTLPERLEFLYLSPYYLQAFFFLVGTLSWFLAEALFASRLPFWTELWGWSLVLTNIIALPLLNGIGLFLEESEQKDYAGLLSFIALSYIVVPFQAYASVKGFLEKEEGPWFRTPKTGKITDVFGRSKFYRFISGILPSRAAVNPQSLAINNQYLAYATANNKWEGFKIRPKQIKWVGKLVLVLLLSASTLLSSMARFVPFLPIQEAKAYDGVIEDSNTNWTKKFIYDHPEYASMPITQRDETSIHFLKPDGQIEAQILGGPINYQDENSVWNEIDTKIVESGSADFDYVNLTNKYKTYFSSNLSSGIANIKLEKNGASVSFTTLDSMKISKKDNEGKDIEKDIGYNDIKTPGQKDDSQRNKFTYASAVKDEDDIVNISYLVQESRFKEEITLTKYLNVKEISQEIILENAYAKEEGNSVGLYKKGTEEFLWNLQPKMYEQGDESKVNYGLHFIIKCKEKDKETKDCTDLILTKVVDAEGQSWLSDPQRQYPVTIDPDFIEDAADGQVAGRGTSISTARSTSYSFDSTAVSMRVGQYWLDPNYWVIRTFLKFVTSSIPDTATITQVNLKLVCVTDVSNTNFDVQIVDQGDQGWSGQDPLSDANREAAYDNCLAGTADDNIWRNTLDMATNTQYTSGNLSTTWVSKTGNTYYSLRSSRDKAANTPGGREDINVASQENTTESYRPILTVVYEEGVIPENVVLLLGFGVIIPFWIRRRKEIVEYTYE